MQAAPAIVRRRRERWFFIAMSVAMVITVFAGFAPTYYLRPFYNTAPLMPLLHLHGVVFTSWLVLFVVQISLIATRRVNTHRRLGVAGGVIAVLMILIGVTTAVIRAKQGATPIPEVSPLSFLVIPIGDIFVFAILVSAGFYFRRRPDVHKRLMLLATIAVLDAAIARLPFEIMKAGPPAFFGLTDVFVLACVIFDLITIKRVHRATILAAILIIGSQPLRLLIGGTPLWLAFAGWLTRLVP
ncbi:MAG: hypothetical protein QOD75_242 [Blastocatellia bacterium]|jgi:hypothetical protein|nr:hypothetical protein [Blastocatellia bacterium]